MKATAKAAIQIQKVWRGHTIRKRIKIWICDSCHHYTFMLHPFFHVYVCGDCWEDFEDEAIQSSD
jgi:hypothetical protein